MAKPKATATTKRATKSKAKSAPPGRKAGPKPKATPFAQSASASAPSVAMAPALEGGGKPSKEEVATTNQVTRLLRLKFSHVSRTKLATAVDSEQQSLEQVISSEIRRTNLTGEYIKANFWTKIEQDFGLLTCDWEALEEPGESIAETDPYDMDLPPIVMLVLGDNPAMKTKGMDRLETHLESCDRLPLRQVYGLLLESCESSKVSRCHSQRFQRMLLRYIAKFGVRWVSGQGEPQPICCGPGRPASHESSDSVAFSPAQKQAHFTTSKCSMF